ncbi:PIG-L family deacetylase [Mycolicibacterium moriokaense]|nr:PIG-L family deacetylase [Mycolicibacterium moriokaense]
MLVPHPDDIEWGCATAVAKWTSQGKHVHYALACRGEAGIEGMPPHECGPLREREQRLSSAIVGVHDVEFWDFPDGEIFDTPQLRAKIAETIMDVAPEVVITLYSGPEWAPGAPNQRDHIEFSNAVAGAYDSLADKPKWFFEHGPGGTHGETVDEFIEGGVDSLAAHDVYLSAIDPDTPVRDQARKVVDMTTLPPLPGLEGHRSVEFILKRETGR